MSGSGIKLGIDIGGTFTDIVIASEEDAGSVLVVKVPTTPEDQSRSIVSGMQSAIELYFDGAAHVVHAVHGTTAATNAILEGKGAKTGLITTKGFRDILELRRMRTSSLYDLAWQKPEPLVPRSRRVEVVERVSANGEIETPICGESCIAAIRSLAEQQVESVAVCLLNSHANADHEQEIGRQIETLCPELHVSLSCEVSPEIKEYERTSTTTVNAYLKPEISKYLKNIELVLQDLGLSRPLLIMQSNGGVAGVEATLHAPIHIIESGPAAGVVCAKTVASQIGVENVLTFDMGGTTAKASMIENGEYRMVSGLDVGAGINSSRMLSCGDGYHVRTQVIDVAEVGAGGGSLVSIDSGGVVQVGPESAGAVPGPACYAAGGSNATVTDANVVLGLLNPEYLAGGEVPIDADCAREALSEQVAASLDISVENAAYGVHLIANSAMARAIHAVSSERGRDPRDFSLMAFGGNGPLHAATLAESIGMSDVIVPPASGVLSALGLLYADLEHHYVRTFKRELEAITSDQSADLYHEMSAEGKQALQQEGCDTESIVIRQQVDLFYRGENAVIVVNVPDDLVSSDLISHLRKAFEEEHDNAFGYVSPDESVEILNLRVVAVSAAIKQRKAFRANAAVDMPASSGEQSRQVYFGQEWGWVDTPVLNRVDIDEIPRVGPIIVEEYHSTTLVPPRWTIESDSLGNFRLKLVK